MRCVKKTMLKISECILFDLLIRQSYRDINQLPFPKIVDRSLCRLVGVTALLHIINMYNLMRSG